MKSGILDLIDFKLNSSLRFRIRKKEYLIIQKSKFLTIGIFSNNKLIYLIFSI